MPMAVKDELLEREGETWVGRGLIFGKSAAAKSRHGEGHP
jgi:hypothetical protein